MPIITLAEELGVDPSAKRLAKKVSRKIADAMSSSERADELITAHFTRARVAWAREQVRRVTWSVATHRMEIRDQIKAAEVKRVHNAQELLRVKEGRRWEEHYRIEAAAQRLGWIHIGYGAVPNSPMEHQEESWVYLGDGEPRSLLSDFGFLFVKDKNLWFDVGTLGLTEDEGQAISGWLILANRHNFRLAGRMARNPQKAYEWLLARKPTRKGLESKFRKFMEALPCHHDWSDRQPNEVLAHLGAWHCQNEGELMEVGRKNGWCFGAEYHTFYINRLMRGAHLWFIPTEKGLISAFKDWEGPKAPWAEVKLPHNEEAGDLLTALERQAAEELREKAEGGRYWREAEQYWAATGH